MEARFRAVRNEYETLARALRTLTQLIRLRKLATSRGLRTLSRVSELPCTACIRTCLTHLTTTARARRALVDVQRRIDGAHLLTDRLHLGAQATAAPAATTLRAVAASATAAATTTLCAIAAAATTTCAIAAASSALLPAPPIATVPEATSAAAAVATAAAEACRAKSRHLRDEIVELLLLFRMRLEDFVDLLAFLIGNLLAAEALAAATLTALLLDDGDFTAGAAGRAARCSARSAVARTITAAACAAAAATTAIPATSTAARREAAAVARHVEALRGHLLRYRIRRQAEHRARRNCFAWILDRIVRDGDDAVVLIDEHVDHAVHARLEQRLVVLEVHEHREHRHVLLNDRLRLDLLDHAAEATIGIGVDRDVRGLARMDVANVALVEERAHAHDVEVGHLHDRGATAHGARRTGDDGSDGHRLVDDRAFSGGLHRRFLERLLREIEVSARLDDVRLRGLVRNCRVLVFLWRYDACLEEILIALTIALGDGEARLGRIERGLHLVVFVLDVARVDLHDQVAGVDLRARFHRHLGDDARRLGLHFDDRDRLDHAVRLRIDDDVASRDHGSLHGRRLLLLRASGDGEEQGRSEYSFHVGLSPENRPKRLDRGLAYCLEGVTRFGGELLSGRGGTELPREGTKQRVGSRSRGNDGAGSELPAPSHPNTAKLTEDRAR